MDIEHIREMVQRGAWVPTLHFLERLDQRGIDQEQVLEAIANGTIIVEFTKRHPNPECIIEGLVTRRLAGMELSVPLYVTCGVGEVIFFISVDWNPPRQLGQKRRR